MVYDEFKIIVIIMMKLLFYIWSKRFHHLEHCHNLRKVLHKTRWERWIEDHIKQNYRLSGSFIFNPDTSKRM